MTKTILILIAAVLGSTAQARNIDALPQDESLLLLSPVALPSSLPPPTEAEKIPSRACRISPAGFVDGEMKKFRITLRGKTLAGADSLEGLAEAGALLEDEKECSFEATAVCRLTEEGPAGGEWHRARIQLNGRVITGADGFLELASALQALGEARFCHFTEQHCDLASEGAVGGAWFKHRVLVDGVPVLGAADLGSIVEQVTFLRQIGVCR